MPICPLQCWQNYFDVIKAEMMQYLLEILYFLIGKLILSFAVVTDNPYISGAQKAKIYFFLMLQVN